jgi:hypothetical protein
MTTVNVDGYLVEELAYRNLTGFHILAAIARAAHFEREGICFCRVQWAYLPGADALARSAAVRTSRVQSHPRQSRLFAASIEHRP